MSVIWYDPDYGGGRGREHPALLKTGRKFAALRREGYRVVVLDDGLEHLLPPHLVEAAGRYRADSGMPFPVSLARMSRAETERFSARVAPAARRLTDEEFDELMAEFGLAEEAVPAAAEGREYARVVAESLAALEADAEASGSADLAEFLIELGELSPRDWRRLQREARERRELREAIVLEEYADVWDEIQEAPAADLDDFLADAYAAMPKYTREALEDPEVYHEAELLLELVELTETELQEREEGGEDSIIAGPFPLSTTKFVRVGRRSREWRLETDADAPLRDILEYFSRDALGRDYTALLRFWRREPGGGDERLSEWERWRTGVGRDGDWTAIIRVAPDQAFYKRVTALWHAIQRNRSEYNDVTHVEFRFDPIPDRAERAMIRQWHSRDTNCAIKILCVRRPALANKLRAVKLAEDGSFRYEQAWDVAGVLGQNIVCKDRLGQVMYETKKPDGEWRYKHDENHPPYELYAIEEHAVGVKPACPELKKALNVPIELRASLDFFALQDEFGPRSVIWPRGPGAAVVERANDPPVLVREQVGFEAVKRRAAELGMDDEHDYALAGSPFSLDVKDWRLRNCFGPTPKQFAELWRETRFEPPPYVRGLQTPALEHGPVRARDMNSAYEGCWGAERRDLWTDAGRDLWDRYGMPSDRMAAIREPPMSVLHSHTGMVVAVLRLDGCHPWVRHLCRGEPRGTFTTMRLGAWVSRGAAVVERLELAVLAVPHWPSGERPPGTPWSAPRVTGAYGAPLVPPGPDGAYPAGTPRDMREKDWGRQAIGRLVPSVDKAAGINHIYVKDPVEASYLARGLAEAGTLAGFERVPRPRRAVACDLPVTPAGGVDHDAIWAELMAEECVRQDVEPPSRECAEYFRIGVAAEPCSTASHHTHAYILDYAACAVDREVFAHDFARVVAVKTDSVALDADEPFATTIMGSAPSQWKDEAYTRREYSAWDPRFVGGSKTSHDGDLDRLVAAASEEAWGDATLALETLTSAAAGRMRVVEGPPGYGKTHHCATGIPKGAITLTPTHKLRTKLGAGYGLRAFTWQWALKPGKTFRPEAILGRIPRGSTVYLTEVGKIPQADAAEIIPWLLGENGCIVLADGDRKQGLPVKGSSPWTTLDVFSDTTPWCGTDHRSKEPELAATKLQLRDCATNAAVFAGMAAAVGADTYESFLAAWHPRDFVYVAVHGRDGDEGRRKVTADLTARHHESYPDELVRVRHGEGSGKRNGEEEYVGLGDPVPRHAEVAYTATYSSCQGDTAGPDENGRSPRVWLFTERCSEYFKNEAYVAATRVEHMAQWGVVTTFPTSAAQLAADAYEFG